MPVTRAFPDSVSAVDTSAMYELGTEWYMDAGEAEAISSSVQGPQVWVYVFNDDASTDWAQGNVIAIDAATADYDGILAAVDTPSTRLLGVAQHAIAAGSYGWILKKGLGEVLADANTIDVNEGVYVSDTTPGTGMEANIAVTAANTSITAAHLAGPFAWATEDAAEAALATCFIDIK